MDPIRSSEPEIRPDLPDASQTSNGAGPDTASSQPTPLKQIRTFQGDVADTIGRQNESLVSIQRAEHAKSGAPSTQEPSSAGDGRKALLLILGTIFFLLAGTGGGWLAYNQYIKKTTPPVITLPINRLISAAGSARMESASSSRSEIISFVASTSETPLSAGEVTHIETPLTTLQFLEVLEVRPPGYLVRALDDTFMLGTLSGGSTASTSVFLIIKIGSFENTFAGMLEWETRMAEDIGALFSTRAALAELEPGGTFVDVTRRNKDSRVLYAPTGEVLLAYSFFDQETLVITDSVESLETLLGRLANELLSR